MKKQTKLPQRKPEKHMDDKELLNKLETKIYGKEKKGDMEKLADVVKSRLKNFDKFSIN